MKEESPLEPEPSYAKSNGSESSPVPSASATPSLVSLSELREELDLPLPPCLTRGRRFATHRSSHRSHRSRYRSRSRYNASHQSRPQQSDLQMRVRQNEAWKMDRHNAPRRLEKLQKLVLPVQNQELVERYQEAAGLAGREAAPVGTVDDGVRVVNLPPEPAVICSDWRLALDEDDDDCFAAPPIFDS